MPMWGGRRPCVRQPLRHFLLLFETDYAAFFSLLLVFCFIAFAKHAKSLSRDLLFSHHDRWAESRNNDYLTLLLISDWSPGPGRSAVSARDQTIENTDGQAIKHIMLTSCLNNTFKTTQIDRFYSIQRNISTRNIVLSTLSHIRMYMTTFMNTEYFLLCMYLLFCILLHSYNQATIR